MTSARVFESVAADIRERVSMGELEPGDKLSSERLLAERYGVSRAGVREALRSLEREGVIEVRKGPGGGAFIRTADAGLVMESLSNVIALSAVPIADLTESRTILMTTVVRLACERGTDADFDRLDESITITERLSKEGNLEARRVQLLGFYRLLGQATRNEVMVILVSVLTDLVLKLMAQYDVGQRPATVRTHRKIVRCLRQRASEEAIALMASHLEKLHLHFRKSALEHGYPVR